MNENLQFLVVAFSSSNFSGAKYQSIGNRKSLYLARGMEIHDGENSQQ